MQRWEYCAIGPITGVSWGFYYPKRIVISGGREYDNTQNLSDSSLDTEFDNVTSAISEMGDTGWEMVGCGNVSVKSHYLYFKRPKE